MHTENDPCVRYDPKRKIWIYLHRNRTEEEFERMHQQFQGVSKHKKQSSRKSKTSKTNIVKSVSSKSPNTTSSKKLNCVQTVATISPDNVVKKKVIATTLPTQGNVVIFNSTAQKQTPQQTTTYTFAHNMSSPPALSSINSVATLNNPPPLISKIITNQKKPHVQPELITINQKSEDLIDIDPNSVHVAPVVVTKASNAPNQTQSTIQGLILDENQKLTTNIIGSPSIGIVSVSNSSPIKVATPTGFQSVRVLAGQTLVKQKPHSILQPNVNQSNLSGQPKLQVRQIQQTKDLPPLVAAHQSPNHIIPISLGKSNANIKTIQPIVAQASPTSLLTKTVKTSAVPTLTSSVNIQRAVSLLQTQSQQLINVNDTKAMVNASNTVSVPTSATMQIIHAKPFSQQKIIVAKSENNMMGNKPTLVGTSATPIVVQKIIATSSSPIAVTTSPITSNTKTIASVMPGASLINPNIIQIHQANKQRTTQTGKVKTITTANLSQLQQHNILQAIKPQQIRLQATSQNSLNAMQQSLVIKPTQVFHQIPKPTQQGKPQATQIQLNAASSSASFSGAQMHLTQNPKKITSMIMTAPSISLTNTTNSMVQSTFSQATIKAGTSLIHTTANNSLIQQPTTMQTSSPIIGKVLTDQTGQIISLENLIQQKQPLTSATSLRLATSKANVPTSFIQLTGASGSQIAQYAVVSKGRNLISVAPRLITTQAANTSIENAGGDLIGVTGVKTTTGASAQSSPKTEIITVNQRAILSPTSQQTVAQNQQILQQQLQQNASPKVIQSAQPISKILGVQGFQNALINQMKPGSNIRMVNASNLNIANIGGKPVLIASKSPIIQSSNQQRTQTQIVQQQTQNAQQTKQVNWVQQTNNVTCGNTNFVISGAQVQNVQTKAPQTQTVMFGNQFVKIQPNQTFSPIQSKIATSNMSVINLNANIVTSTNNSNIATLTTPTRTVLSAAGTPIKLQTTNVRTTTPNTKATTVSPKVLLGPSNVKVIFKKIIHKEETEFNFFMCKLQNVIKGTNLASPGQRVVLAVQGGSQFILPSNFQGGTINLKSLQGLKMIPIQTQNTAQMQTNISKS